MYGPDHHLLGFANSGYSVLLRHLGEIEGAYEHRRRSLEILERDQEDARSSMILSWRLHFAQLAMLLGRTEEARARYRVAISMVRDGVEVSPSPQRNMAEAVIELAALVAKAGHHEDALQLFEIAALDAARYPDLQAQVHRDWAVLLRQMDRDEQAREHEAQAAALIAVDGRP